MDLAYITELFDESRRVWKETEIEERKVIARILVRGGFLKKEVARWLGLSESSIYKWARQGIV